VAHRSWAEEVERVSKRGRCRSFDTYARLAGMAALLVGTSGCVAPLASFDPVTPQGASISDLFVLALIPTALIFLLVVGVLIAAIVRFRGRPGDADPPQVEGNRRLELAWTAAPAFLLAVFFVLTVRTMSSVNAESPSAMRVEVVGHQWWWEYRYPDLNVVTANELHVPVGVPLRLELTSNDVIHSFWAPQFGWKKDAIPGQTNTMPVQIDQPGVYDGTCTEYCGTQHAWMRVRVVAQSTDEFNAWVQQQQQPAPSSQDPTAARGQQVFTGSTCVNCHTLRGTAANGQVGPDLTHFGSRSIIGAGVLENTPDNLRQWISNPQAIKPGVLMPGYSSLSDDDLTALVTYLEGP
jgi:cytochrome c oxidase subunit II